MNRVPGILSMLIGAALAFLGGCATDTATGPPDIKYGRDVCLECHMIISEPRFAAAYRDPDGTPSIFDDIGDMIDHGEGEAALDEVTAWVHDYHDGKWIDAPDAWFVSGSDTTTPMAGNIVAFRTQGSARDFIRSHGGELRSWSTLIEERSVDAGAEPDSETRSGN